MQRSYHYGQSLPPGELRKQIEEHLDPNKKVTVPTFDEARELLLKVEHGDELAIERVVQLYFFMPQPVSDYERDVVKIVFEAFRKAKFKLYEKG